MAMDERQLQQRGLSLLNQGNPEEALPALKKATELDPNLVPAWSGKGDALRTLGRHEEALEAYDRARELDPGHAPAWHGRGMVLRDMEEYESALEEFNRAEDLDPTPALPLYGKSLVLSALNRSEEALDAVNEALSYTETFPSAWQSKAERLRELGRPEEALEALEVAIELGRENAPVWRSMGRVLLELDRRAEAHRAFNRVVYLAESASTPRYRQLAAEEIPSVLSYFQDTGGAPLLVVSLVERHELLNVYLQEPRPIRRAYERTAPYRLLRHYFGFSESESEARKHGLLGLSAFYLGDPLLAQKHFDRLDTLNDEDMFGAFYYARTHQEYAQNDDANIIIDVSREHAEKVLRIAEQNKGVNTKQLYYAGQLFASGASPQLSKARQCFEATADRAFLPGMYMRAWSIRQLEGTSEAYANAVEALLEEEKKRESGKRSRTETPGFLRRELPEFSASSEKDLRKAEAVSAKDASEAVNAIEKLLWHRAHSAEITDAIRDVYHWMEKEQTGGKEYDSLLTDHEPSPELDDWIANRQHVNILHRQLQEKASIIDLDGLRARLEDRTHIPDRWLKSDQTSPEEWERFLGRKIREDEKGNHFKSHQEVIIYLALRGQISGHVALALSSYLLASTPSSVGESIAEDTAEALVGGLIGTGGSELLRQAGVKVALLGGFPLDIGSSLAATFIVKRVIDSEGQRLKYSDFREEFDRALEGQPDETYRTIQNVIDQIESRQTSPTT